MILIDALNSIPVSDLSYDEWVRVGMALKNEGYPISIWDEWSQNDTRYNSSEIEKKWASFNGTGVTAGTVFHIAERYGFVPSKEVINKDTDLIKYLKTLFKSSDLITLATKASNNSKVPIRGPTIQVGKLIQRIKDMGVENAIGKYDHSLGALIRTNPMDGNGVSDKNITEFKYVLIESDTLPINDQRKAFEKLKLPIATLVNSGNRSLHALVKIDAKNIEEYKERVKILYDYIISNGVDIDPANKNPSRMTRLPGVERNGHFQTLVATNIGPSSWDDFFNVIKFSQEGLPPIENLSESLKNPPLLPNELIEGILREGHKLLISGPSKAGKSFLMMELAIAIAEGEKWLGFSCMKGRVLYLNFEIDGNSAKDRFLKIYKALGVSKGNLTNIDIWNLRGKAQPLENLTKTIIKYSLNKGYIAIFLDPIYKIQCGDENSAKDIAKFCNSLDEICSALRCSVVYSHHHSKGAQGHKSTADRASGSGVFARDADALLDLTPLVIEGAKAYRVTSALREFKDIHSINILFEYPIHIVSDSEELKNAPLEGTSAGNRAKSSKYTTVSQRRESIENAFAELYKGSPILIEDIAKMIGVTPRTVKDRIKEIGPPYHYNANLAWKE